MITELVCNHTSDQHPWFQRARRSAPDSAYRNFYVWSDTPDKYKEVRIIFKDFEPSNWSFDPVAGSHYWHRFFRHQPDLNFDNPRVHVALRRAMDFWLEMGVDGMRLDAIPYLYEREGTSCENLPEGFEFLQAAARPHRRTSSRDRMLLAEANQWPEDAVAYFGEGDMCQMSFHFPLMPRLFMGLYMEDRFPIVDILRQTPAIPDNCQWAVFLRNHDELTLEMVTDEERDYMYRVYANDARMRINLGIRRRLAPLLGNHRRRIELMNGLLFSLPGTPVIYYGDEMGMGDNVYLGDRNGVRTPMQWSRRPQRRLLARQPAAALPAGDHRPRVPLRDAQRRGAAAQPALAATGGCAASSPCASATRRSAAARWSSYRPENRKSSPSCASTRTSASSSSPTCRASCRASSSTSRASRACGRSRSSAASTCRRSASSRTSSPWGRTASTGSRWSGSARK